jgi:F0F1-type ATP synthase membrane subunit c/vacuolar-type H+-ATPase subunit K
MADIVPIVMAGIIGIYGLVVSVLIANDLSQKLALYTGFIQLGAGLAVGLAGMAAGYVADQFSWTFLKLTRCPPVLPLVLSVMPVSGAQRSSRDSMSE